MCSKHFLEVKITSGIVSSGLWEKLDINERIKKLKKDTRNLKGVAPESEQFSEKVTLIYSKLRETWERVVEEVLLNGVVN